MAVFLLVCKLLVLEPLLPAFITERLQVIELDLGTAANTVRRLSVEQNKMPP